MIARSTSNLTIITFQHENEKPSSRRKTKTKQSFHPNPMIDVITKYTEQQHFQETSDVDGVEENEMTPIRSHITTTIPSPGRYLLIIYKQYLDFPNNDVKN